MGVKANDPSATEIEAIDPSSKGRSSVYVMWRKGGYWLIPLVQPPTVFVFIDHVEKLSIRRLELQAAFTMLLPRRPARMPLVHERGDIGGVLEGQDLNE